MGFGYRLSGVVGGKPVALSGAIGVRPALEIWQGITGRKNN
jgi:hypothetical protein